MKKQIAFLISVFCLMILVFQNCSDGFDSQRPQGDTPSHFDDGTVTGNPGQGKITFFMVYSKVFESNCVSCHQGRKADGGVRYDTYENALRHGKLETLRESYEEHREPAKECSTISKPQMDLVVRWINDESQYDD